MSPSSPLPFPRRRVERALAARIVTALGLALLLVVGAWSTSHGDAESPATICLGSGASTSAAADAGQHEEVTAIDVLSSDAAICAVAALCCIALVLLLRRLVTARGSALLGRIPRLRPITRAGPLRRIPALTLAQLSVSRT